MILAVDYNLFLSRLVDDLLNPTDAEVVRILQALGKADSDNRHDNLEALDRAFGIET
jgi:hypothetical protein